MDERAKLSSAIGRTADGGGGGGGGGYYSFDVGSAVAALNPA